MPIHKRPITFWELTVFLAGGSALTWLYVFIQRIISAP
jgi:hypothetical protein